MVGDPEGGMAARMAMLNNLLHLHRLDFELIC
jgi:hypothetical protein